MFFLKQALYVVGIPIGNIFDFSQRAIFILKNVDIIATEDSRKAGLLLKFLNIKSKLISLNSYNEISLSYFFINNIKNGSSIALISDSGTPLISDPGFFLVELFYKNNLRVIPIPGVSSFLTALSISAFNVDCFIFEGFLPKKDVYKKAYLYQFVSEKKVVIFFETSKRLLSTLLLMKSIYLFNRRVFIVKNLTRLYENILLFELGALDIFLKQNDFLFFDKGEFVLLLEGVDNDFSSFKNCYEFFIEYINKRNSFFYSMSKFSSISRNLFYMYIF